MKKIGLNALSFLYYKYKNKNKWRKNMYDSERFYKIENDKIISLTLEEEVEFVSSQIQDKDLRDLYLYYYNKYTAPNAEICVYPDGFVEFNQWYEGYYDDYETEALSKIVHSILPKKYPGAIDDITFKNIQVKLKELKANKDFE